MHRLCDEYPDMSTRTCRRQRLHAAYLAGQFDVIVTSIFRDILSDEAAALTVHSLIPSASLGDARSDCMSDTGFPPPI